MSGIRPDPARAAPLASRKRLVAVHTAVVEARVLGVGDMGAAFEWAPHPIEVAWSFTDNEYRAIVSFGTTIGQKRADVLTPVSLIRTVLRIDYRSIDATQPTEEDAMHYLGMHAVLHGWPFFRADVQAFTARLELPPLTLPVLVASNVTQLATVRRLTDEEMRPPPSTTVVEVQPLTPALPPRPVRKRKRRKK